MELIKKRREQEYKWLEGVNAVVLMLGTLVCSMQECQESEV